MKLKIKLIESAMCFRMVLALCLFMGLQACQPDSPKENAGQNTTQQVAHGFTVSQSQFDALNPEQQFMLANKALSVLYRGIPLDQYLDLTQGLTNPMVRQSNFLSHLQSQLQTPLTFDELQTLNSRIFGVEDNPETQAVDESIQGRFSTFDRDHPHQVYLAKILTYPHSKDLFVNWMAYFLANTIMFSPAREMDSTNSQDIVRVLGYLEQSLAAGTPVRDLIRGWLHNLSRWRVSRSPENHALEMFELYLGIFNDTPEEQQNTINGGQACDTWYLTDNDADYQLLKDPTKIEGGRTVQIFGQYVTTCDDLYDVVAGHPLLLPRVIEVIVNYFLDGSTTAVKSELIQDVLATGPTTFDDIFLAVIFSKAFLLDSERPKTFEENALNFLHAMHYTPRSNSGDLGRGVLDRIWDSTNNTRAIAVHNMSWAAMDYKIGRTPFLPLDVLSFATYHKAMREGVLLNNRAYDGQRYPNKEDFTEAENPREPPFPIHDGAFYLAGTEHLKPELQNLNAEEFIDLLFLTALGRRAIRGEGEELEAMLQIGIDRNWLRQDEDEEWQLRGNHEPLEEGEPVKAIWTDDFAEVVLDYMSRLPELYYYRAIE